MPVTGEEHTYHHVRKFLPDGEPQSLGSKTIMLTYTTRWVASPVNVRVEPNTSKSPVVLLAKGTELKVVVEPVSPEILQVLGVAASIDHTYQWAYIHEGQHKGRFVAAKFLTANPPGTPPTTPPAPPSGGVPVKLSTAKNLHVVFRNGNPILADGTGAGANVRVWLYAGTHVGKGFTEALRRDYLQYMKDKGFRWLRFYVFHRDFSVDDTIARLGKVLDEIGQYGLLANIVFSDSLGVSGFTFKEYDKYHVHDWGHLDKSFYHARAWQNPLLPATLRVVKQFKGHQALGLYHVGNEHGIRRQPATTTDSAMFLNFAHDMTSGIASIDSATPISLGLANSHHVAPSDIPHEQWVSSFWRSLPYVHVVSCHAYPPRIDNPGEWEDEAYILNDFRTAKLTARAMMLTEIGSSNGNRPAVERAFWERTKPYGVRGALRWGFMWGHPAQGISDDRGWGHHFGDFNALGDLYQDIGQWAKHN